MKIIKELCRWKGIEIIEGEMAIDHVQLLLSIPPKFSISGVMGYLKGKSSLMIYQKLGQAEFQYRCREFWCRGYYVDMTGKDTEVIKKIHSKSVKSDNFCMLGRILTFIFLYDRIKL